MRVKNPRGSFYRNVSGLGAGKKPEDSRITPATTGFWIKMKTNNSSVPAGQSGPGPYSGKYEVGYREGGEISIASVAMASQLKQSGDFNSETYQKSAEDAFQFIDSNNFALAYDGKNNIVDD